MGVTELNILTLSIIAGDLQAVRADRLSSAAALIATIPLLTT